MLEVRAVKRFRGFCLDLAFRTEARTVLVSGPSGAGKSLLLALLSGALRADAGEARLGADVLFDEARGVWTPPHRRAVGCVFQEARLLPHLSVRGNLLYGLRRSGARPQRFAFGDVVEVLGLGALLERTPGALSGGEAQRVAIGRALLSQPRLLLMDEPLSALDDQRRFEILDYLERVRDAFPAPLVYASHDRAELERLGGALLSLEGGALKSLETLAPGASAPARLTGLLRALGAGLGLAAGDAVFPLDGGGLAAGARVRVLVSPRDVAVVLGPLGPVAAQARLPARITALGPAGPEVLIELETGFGVLRSLVPRTGAVALGAAVGLEVTALVLRAAVAPED
jgi:molybdate transport system ATP-binding protein